ncbi:hypothetical protein LZG74_25540 [Dyadobacter sp. CY327]|uniref:hypothetical protein n=1 Tax=Dyadobacter sp. CY327 TaxID=2907301 RepID=UPI001F2EC943|nr:hypothetical protein [Dyadobacter sp. CY327]MCE7073699.1 hypothetical protein [Dyadobacter sp. CY327]
MKDVLKYLIARLSEASTWRGLVALATGLGVHLDTMDADKIVAAGLGLIGLIGVFFKDKTPPVAPESVVKK